MRTLALLLGVVASVLAACGEDAAPIAAATAPASAGRRAPGASAAPEAGPPARAAPDVVGLAVDDAADPVVGRSIVLVDSRGRRAEATTAYDGSFRVADVVPPYDLEFASAPSGPVVVPVAYFGLSRRDLRVVLDEKEGASAPPPHLVRVVVALPPCDAPACGVSVATASPSGAGAAAREYRPRETTASFEIEHAWRVDAVPSGETIDVHVLTRDDGYTQFAYAHAGAVDGTPSGASDVTIAPARVDAPSRVAIEAVGAAVVSPAWERYVAARLLFPGGGAVTLRIVAGPALVVRLPRVPGAGFDVRAWAEEPRAADRPSPQRIVSAWSGALGLASSDVVLELPSAPELSRPKPDGVLARRGAGVAWTSATPSGTGVVCAALTDVARGRRAFRVFTGGDGVHFARLDRLGIPRPDLGEHALEVTTRRGASVDDLVDPAQDLAAARSPGGSAYQRTKLTVIP